METFTELPDKLKTAQLLEELAAIGVVKAAVQDAINWTRKDWERCIRRKIKPEPVFLPTPKEIEDLLRYESRRLH